MALSPSRRDTIGPPPRDVSDLARVVRHQGSYLRSLDPGLLDGLYSTPRPLLHGTSSQLVGDDGGAEQVLFANTDQGVCSGPNANIPIALSRIPEDGSEQVFYNGTPLKRGDWTRTDTVLTIPGEKWFRAGKVAWVNYAYYDEDPDIDPPVFVAYTLVNGNHTSVAIPPGTVAGDRLVLVLAGRDIVSCSDARFDAGYHDGQRGVWTGIADGTGSPVACVLDSTATDGGVDAVGILGTFRGDPMALTADAGSTGTSAPFNPADPSGGTYGIAAVAMSSGLLSGQVSDEITSTWTTVVRTGGFGAGKMSAYLGYSTAGTPAGTWNTTSGIGVWVARIMGVQ